MASHRSVNIQVWDLWIRISHWSLLVTVAGSWWSRHNPDPWHEILGYAVLVIAMARVAWGFFGSSHARFSQFVRSPRATWNYAQALRRKDRPHYLGHNPLGGWMIVALLFMSVSVCFSGWMYTTDRYWGVEWVETLHARLSDGLWLFVALHVAGVLFSSWHQRENLVLAMFTGRKRADLREDGD